MEQNKHFVALEKCPTCGRVDSSPHLTCIDYTYSKLPFTLVTCNGCNLVYTNPRPVESENGDYYKSADYISHTNSTRGLIGFLYKWVRGINLKRKVKVLKSHNSGVRLLDVGCGTGFFARAAHDSGFRVTGVEPDADARRFAVEHNKIEAYPLEHLNDFTQQFDTVTMWHVLEHVYHLQEQLKTITALIKPGGLFIIALPDYKSFDGTFYGGHWAGYDVPRHLYHFEEKTVAALLKPFGFTLVNVEPMKFDAYYVSMLSEKNKGGSMFKALFKGAKSNRMARQKKHPYSSQVYVFRNKI